jgi:multiple sugar transport system substrate-binding protein
VKSALLLVLLLTVPLIAGPAEEITFLYMNQSGYDPADILDRADAFQQLTGIKVKPIFVEYKDRYTLVTEASRRTLPEYDLILLDLIWTADFARHGIIDALPDPLDRAVREGMVQRIYSAFDYGGRLWAIPFHVDFQMLYTNMDLLSEAGFSSPPRTLEEMRRMARVAKQKGLAKFPLFDSWNEQEVLVCEFTWLTGAFGGSLTDGSGRISCTTGPCLEALDFMTGLLKEGLMNPYSLDEEENFTSEVFQAGDCLFTTNWLWLIRLLGGAGKPSGPRWAVTPIPVSESAPAGTGSTTSVSGFEGLAVMARSVHKDAAWRFARYLDSPEFQGRHLEFMPAWKEVWDWPATRRGDPLLGTKQRQINGLRYRPVHPLYGKISAVLQQWIYRALSGSVAPREALEEAQRGIDVLTGQGP